MVVATISQVVIITVPSVKLTFCKLALQVFTPYEQVDMADPNLVFPFMLKPVVELFTRSWFGDNPLCGAACSGPIRMVHSNDLIADLLTVSGIHWVAHCLDFQLPAASPSSEVRAVGMLQVFFCFLAARV